MAEFPIPAVAMEDCGGIFGRRNAGKSGVGRFLFEHELDAGHRCCVIDPKGDWYGARMLPDGSPSGYDIPIFGGLHGDLELTEKMGAMLGKLIATHNLSCIVDISRFPSVAAMRRFTRDFAEALYENNSQALTLFIDEADQVAPQNYNAKEGGPIAMLLHHMERLIRLGRQRGIFMWMMTQRPQLLNINLRSQCESLVAMKVTTPRDRGAIKEWMDAHDPDQAKAISAELAKLNVGEAFVWVPGADFLERVQFPLFKTYDSGRTPKHGETVTAMALPAIDLSSVRTALSSVAEAGDAESDDAAAIDDIIPADPQQAYAKGSGVGDMFKKWENRVAELEREKVELISHIERLEGDYADACNLINEIAELAQTHEKQRLLHLDAPKPVVIPAQAKDPAPRLSVDGKRNLTGPQKRVLDALGWWLAMGFDEVEMSPLAFIANYSTKTRSFEKARSELRTLELVDYPAPGQTCLTATGKQRAKQPERPASTAELQSRVLSRLNGPQRRVIEPLLAAHPEPVEFDKLAALADYSTKTRSFEKARSELRSLGLVDYPVPGSTRAEDWLFRGAA